MQFAPCYHQSLKWDMSMEMVSVIRRFQVDVLHIFACSCQQEAPNDLGGVMALPPAVCLLL